MLSSLAAAAVSHNSSSSSSIKRTSGDEQQQQQQHLAGTTRMMISQQQQNPMTHHLHPTTGVSSPPIYHVSSSSSSPSSSTSSGVVSPAKPGVSVSALSPEQLAAIALPAVPAVREVSAAGILLLLQEVVGYAARRSNGNKEEAIALLDTQGFSIGVRLLERLALRSQQRILEQRECLKFICKDLWQLLFQKQADRLQTNRRGGYVIQDHNLPWVRRLSPATTTAAAAAAADPAVSTAAESAYNDGVKKKSFLDFPGRGFTGRGFTGREEARATEGDQQHWREGKIGMTPATGTAAAAGKGQGYEECMRDATAFFIQQQQQQRQQEAAAAAAAALSFQPAVHVALLCGIIRGALAGMGLTCTVSADTSNSPYCSFQVRIPSP